MHHHASVSCIIPIEAAGFHQIEEGSTNAIMFLENILANNSYDLHSRWLLNIAFMTMGKYPSEVLENDGDQDIHVEMGGAFEGDNFFNSLYENPYQDENNWITIIVEGIKSNRFAIGSRLTVTIQEKGQERKIYHTISSGGSFGCSTLRAKIGLGKASEIKQLEILWAGSGTRQVFKDISLNKFYKIVEGNSQAEELFIQPLTL